jgi:hypothetical protein
LQSLPHTFTNAPRNTASPNSNIAKQAHTNASTAQNIAGGANSWLKHTRKQCKMGFYPFDFAMPILWAGLLFGEDGDRRTLVGVLNVC